MKNPPEVVWIPRDHVVKDLIDQYLKREIDYLALNVAFRKNGWSTAGLSEVVTHMESKLALEKMANELEKFQL